jgi:hypothetical protein
VLASCGLRHRFRLPGAPTLEKGIISGDRDEHGPLRRRDRCRSTLRTSPRKKSRARQGRRRRGSLPFAQAPTLGKRTFLDVTFWRVGTCGSSFPVCSDIPDLGTSRRELLQHQHSKSLPRSHFQQQPDSFRRAQWWDEAFFRYERSNRNRRPGSWVSRTSFVNGLVGAPATPSTRSLPTSFHSREGGWYNSPGELPSGVRRDRESRAEKWRIPRRRGRHPRCSATA